MEIREAIAGDDVDTVACLRVAFIADHRGVAPAALGDDFVARTAAFVLRRHAEGTMRSWLAHEAEEAVGVVSVLALDMPPRHGDDLRSAEGYIVNMFVRPTSRGNGIGRALFDTCTAAAREQGMRRLFLRATDMGRPLYERSGFAPNDEWMELRLPPAP